VNTQAQGSGFSHGYCTECGKHDYVGPLHGERGGPRCCMLCIGNGLFLRRTRGLANRLNRSKCNSGQMIRVAWRPGF
jgi:hypothetical protein